MRRSAEALAAAACAAIVLAASWVGAQADPASAALLKELTARAERAKLAEDPTWKALLHYERDLLLPRTRSRSITQSFFLSERGDRDADAELRATLAAFFDPGATVKDGEHPQCAFVARRHWLEERLQLEPGALPAVECTEYQRWRDGLDARGLTLIFPEGFMNSPASMFGHTLLRIDSQTGEGPVGMLGHGVDFTANSRDDNTFVTLAKGVFGLYPGFFSVRPYDLLLKRYADWENRNIWEYQLEVTDEQLELLLMHLWELRGIEFTYLFFTKNCSYELLRLLDLAIPELEAADEFRATVIPVDTLRELVEHPGLVGSVRYRSSPEAELRAALASLPREDRARAQSIAWRRLDPEDAGLEAIPAERRAAILEVAYDQLRYEFLAGQVSDEDSRSLSRRILVARSRVEAAPQESEAVNDLPVPEVRPDQGHDSSLLALRGGWRDDESFVELRWQPALHDLIDSGAGFSEHMQLRFLDTRLRVYPESGRVRLQRLTLFEATSLSPRSRVFRPISWSFRTGLRTRRVPDDDDDLEDAYVWGTDFGIGLAFDPARAMLFYALADARLDVGADLEDKVALGPGGRVGLVLGATESRWKGHLFGEVTRYLVGDATTGVRAGVESRVATSRNTSLVADGSFHRLHGQNWFEGSLSLNLHF